MGSWSSEAFTASPEFATGLTDHAGEARVSRGGANGLRVTRRTGSNTWTSALADSSCAVGKSAIAASSSGINYIVYHDTTNGRVKLAIGN